MENVKVISKMKPYEKGKRDMLNVKFRMEYINKTYQSSSLRLRMFSMACRRMSHCGSAR